MSLTIVPEEIGDIATYRNWAATNAAHTNIADNLTISDFLFIASQVCTKNELETLYYILQTGSKTEAAHVLKKDLSTISRQSHNAYRKINKVLNIIREVYHDD